MRASRDFSITRRTRARFFSRSPAASICDSSRASSSRSRFRWAMKHARVHTRSRPTPKTHLIYAAPDREHILYAAELGELARTAPGFSYETVIAPAEEIYDRLLE